VQAAERLSRGQEKTLICTLKLAQVALLLKETGKRCLFLIDDFAAELDIHNRERLVQLLQVLDSQVFITGITREDLANSWSEQSDLRVFHVEHGEITSQSDSEQGMTLDV
jgi:DNA replication and repair protein RecF